MRLATFSTNECNLKFAEMIMIGDWDLAFFIYDTTCINGF